MEAGGAEEEPGERTEEEGQREKILNGKMGDKKFGDEGGLDCTVEVYMSEESEGGVTVIQQRGAAPRVRAAKSSELG